MNENLKKWNRRIEHLEKSVDDLDLFSYRNSSIERELDKYIIKLMGMENDETALSIALKIKSNKIDRHDKKLKHFKNLYYSKQITLEQFDGYCSGVEQDMRATFELAS